MTNFVLDRETGIAFFTNTTVPRSPALLVNTVLGMLNSVGYFVGELYPIALGGVYYYVSVNAEGFLHLYSSGEHVAIGKDYIPRVISVLSSREWINVVNKVQLCNPFRGYLGS